MSQTEHEDYWAESNSGLRGSTLLRIGGILTIMAPAGKSLADLIVSNNTPVAETIMLISLLTWILALLVLAVAFFWIGAKPFLGHSGWFVGAFHLLYSVFIMSAIFANVAPPVSGVAMSMGRNLCLVFFALIERKYLGQFAGKIMITVGLLQCVKITLRILDLMPSLGRLEISALDSLFLILLGVSIFLVSTEIRKSENFWARQVLSTRSKGFAAFNNPEHEWNKEDES